MCIRDRDIPIQSHFPYISPGVGNARLGHPFMDGCQLVRCYHNVQMDIPLAVLHQRSSSRPFRRSLGSFTLSSGFASSSGGVGGIGAVSYTHLYGIDTALNRESFAPPQSVVSAAESDARDAALETIGETVLGLYSLEEGMQQIAEIQNMYRASVKKDVYKRQILTRRHRHIFW